jgi:hypothetical protein
MKLHITFLTIIILTALSGTVSASAQPPQMTTALSGANNRPAAVITCSWRENTQVIPIASLQKAVVQHKIQGGGGTTINLNWSTTVTNEYSVNGNVSITPAVISAGVGYSVGASTAKTISYSGSFTVPQKQVWELQAVALYRGKLFNIQCVDRYTRKVRTIGRGQAYQFYVHQVLPFQVK